jgi:hypothetical protein
LAGEALSPNRPPRQVEIYPVHILKGEKTAHVPIVQMASGCVPR